MDIACQTKTNHEILAWNLFCELNDVKLKGKEMNIF